MNKYTYEIHKHIFKPQAKQTNTKKRFNAQNHMNDYLNIWDSGKNKI